MNQTKYVTEPTEFYKILLDDTVQNLNIQFGNEDMVQMTYNFKDHFVDNSNSTNIYIAESTRRKPTYDVEIENQTWATSAQVNQGDNLFPINPAGSSSIVSSSYIPANRGE